MSPKDSNALRVSSFIERFNPDIIALQEVIPSTEKQFHFRLKKAYPYRVSSFELAPDQTILKRARMFGQLICSKSPPGAFFTDHNARALARAGLIRTSLSFRHHI